MSFGTVDNGVKPAFNPLTSDSDHRKRRRNRTTLSCINCHTSKRRCDRKRPACARCTQLGLTGLCVYEVEDPNQTSDTGDETKRLLRRVAELETVVRELKNRPGPLRSQHSGMNSSTGSAYAWQPHFHPSNLGQDALAEASTSTPSSSTSASVPSTPTLSYAHHTHPRLHPQHHRIITSERLDTDYHTHHVHHVPLHLPPPLSFLPYPFSYPSSNTSPPPLHNHHPTYTNPDTDTGTDTDRLVPPKLELAPEDEPMPCFPTRSRSRSPHNENPHTETSHCGCLQDPTTHASIRDLSVQLQTTLDVLVGRHHHRSCTGMCVLRERIGGLDRVVLNALATATTTNAGDRASLGPRSPTTTSTSLSPPTVGAGAGEDDLNRVSASERERERHTQSPIQDSERSRYQEDFDGSVT